MAPWRRDSLLFTILLFDVFFISVPRIPVDLKPLVCASVLAVTIAIVFNILDTSDNSKEEFLALLDLVFFRFSFGVTLLFQVLVVF
jgi:hypothetical protein